MKMKMMMLAIVCTGMLLVLPANAKAEAPPADQPAEASNQEELEKQFAARMSGAMLVGHYTVGDEGEVSPKEEKYTLVKVSKLKDDLWLFQARIQYGKNDVTLPLPLRVKWAGDTPVITLDDVPVPGFGTFSARVVIHRNQYAGTWGDKNHGGQLFGKVVPPEAGEKPGVVEGSEENSARSG